jgi:thiamine pyrophosphokinase
MAFTNIDTPGNRHNRRVVAAIQRSSGKETRLAAAQEKRMRRAAKQFERDLDRTIVFYAQPERGFVAAEDPDGAYLMEPRGDRRQIIVAGDFGRRSDHYVNAVSVFLKQKVTLLSVDAIRTEPHITRKFTSILVEVA